MRFKLTIYALFCLAPFLRAQRVNILPDTLHICGDSAFIALSREVGNGAAIRWITPGGVINNTKRIKASGEGRYYIRIYPDNKPGTADSTYVKLWARPAASLRDTTICKETPVVLDAGNPGMRYFWNTGQQGRKIKVTQQGRYWVRITNGKCVTVDTVKVTHYPGSGVQINPEQTFCLNDEDRLLSIKGGGDVPVLWNTGATTPTIVPTREGMYWVRTESPFCGSHTDTIFVKLKACECEMMIPNSFTPNEDNRNDYFFPVTQCEYSFYMLTVTDRWGNTVFVSNNVHTKWDGRYKGNLCPEDIYVYRIESTEKGSDKKLVRTGHISLFR